MRNHLILLETRGNGKKTISIGKHAEERLKVIKRIEEREDDAWPYEIFCADVNAFFTVGEKNSICIKPAEEEEKVPMFAPLKF